MSETSVPEADPDAAATQPPDDVRHTWADLAEQLRAHQFAYHVKDAQADGSMTAVGAGKTDFAALYRRRGSAGVRHFYVENDQAPAPYLPDITTSFRTLKALRY